jgi:transposase InsO family protein
MEVIKSFDNQVSITKMLGWSGIHPSSYYYVPKPGKPGRKPSETTLKTDGSVVNNHEVVEEIKDILGIEFLCYGYVPITDELFDRGFIINHKKVYRLMSQHKLLCGKAIQTHFGKRKFVRFRRIKAEYPLQYLCMDIKYIPINGKFAYLLSLIDVYSRKIVGYVFKTSIRQHDVLWLLKNILPEKANVPITIRNDNGSQFIAKSVRMYLEQINVIHEFTHVATPEENAYIEAFHSIMQRELISRYEFESFYHAEMKITQYIFTYNYIRKHGSLGHRTPASVWNEYFYLLLSDKQPIAAKPENLSRFFDEKFDTTKNQNTLSNFSSKIHFNLDKFVGGAKFDYLMANEFIYNYICKNYQNVFNFLSSF